MNRQHAKYARAATEPADWLVPGLIVAGVLLSLVLVGVCIVYVQMQAVEEARARMEHERARQLDGRLSLRAPPRETNAKKPRRTARRRETGTRTT